MSKLLWIIIAGIYCLTALMSILMVVDANRRAAELKEFIVEQSTIRNTQLVEIHDRQVKIMRKLGVE